MRVFGIRFGKKPLIIRKPVVAAVTQVWNVKVFDPAKQEVHPLFETITQMNGRIVQEPVSVTDAAAFKLLALLFAFRLHNDSVKCWIRAEQEHEADPIFVAVNGWQSEFDPPKRSISQRKY